MLISRLDHLALSVTDVGAAASAYSVLLGQTPVTLAGGAVRLQCENIALVLQPASAPVEAVGAVPMRLVFAATDFEGARHRLSRRGLGGDSTGGQLDFDPAATHGVSLGLVDGAAPRAARAEPCDISGLDHVVVRTRDAERAVALYGGRLGLDLRLDRLRAEMAVRQMFFVLGGLVVEVVQSLKEADAAGDAQDGIWGLAWRTRDIDATRSRLLGAGVDVSEIRDGRKAGSRVATIKSDTCAVPTLLIGGDGLERA